MSQTTLSKGASAALLVSRIIVGGIFVYTGWLKVSDMHSTILFFNSLHIGMLLAYLVSYGELIGGALVVLGLWTEIAALFLTIEMLVAIYLTHSGGFSVFGLPLVMLAGIVTILGCGPGMYTVLLFKKSATI